MELKENCIYSFGFSEKGCNLNDWSKSIDFGKYTISYSDKTRLQEFSLDDIQIAVIGDAVNLAEDKQSIFEGFSNDISGVESFLEKEYFWGGKYVVFFRKKGDYYIIGDATCSVPIYYTFMNGGIICSSRMYDIVEQFNFDVNPELYRIRISGDVFQPMPYDCTVYSQIKQLLPNHFLDISNCCAVRFVNQIEKKELLTADEAAEITLPFIKRLCEYYMAAYKVACPITSGRDSRVVLAFLYNLNKDVPCYTIKHDGVEESEPDLIVAKKIARELNLEYRQINDILLTSEMKKNADEFFREKFYAEKTLKIAQTIKENYKDFAIINGDIIGQVGKCSLHRDIPIFLASPSYFRCKMHNYSHGAKKKQKEWIQDIKKTDEKVNVFDLFSVENRQGRWAAQENEIYNMVGLKYVNIFNSRSIIYEWTRVDRRERKDSNIHTAFLKMLNPVLSEIEYGKEKSFLFKVAKSNCWLYYCSIRLKHIAGKIHFFIKKVIK